MYIWMAIVDKGLGERGHRKTALTAVFPPKQVVCDCVNVVVNQNFFIHVIVSE